MHTPVTQAIRNARRSCRLTQAELALRLGVKPRSVERWETDRAVPSERHRRALVKVIAEVNQEAGSELEARLASVSHLAEPAPAPAPTLVDPRLNLERAVLAMADELDLAPRRVRGSLVRLMRRLGETSFTFQSARQELELWAADTP